MVVPQLCEKAWRRHEHCEGTGQRPEALCKGETEVGPQDRARVFNAGQEGRAFQTEGAWLHGGCPGHDEKLVRGSYGRRSWAGAVLGGALDTKQGVWTALCRQQAATAGASHAGDPEQLSQN